MTSIEFISLSGQPRCGKVKIAKCSNVLSVFMEWFRQERAVRLPAVLVENLAGVDECQKSLKKMWSDRKNE